jgi:hypothetical protein
MKEVVVKDWDSFASEISGIFRTVEDRRAGNKGYVSDPLFRGHADAHWKLFTTLERFSEKRHSIKGYYRILLSVHPAVVSLTGKPWSISPGLEFDEGRHGPPPGYEFMIYLRHYGFPSPLLDWSRSPYVAAFFAFMTRPTEQCENVAIYSYVEHYGRGKGWFEDQPRIIGLGPYAITHERHYAQQSEYTICKKRVGDEYLYWQHEEVLSREEDEQDLLTKFVIPGSERDSFLTRLDVMNINAYSLFRDESSLMHTLAYREIERRNL